jgi:PST family polysaccharide transporter
VIRPLLAAAVSGAVALLIAHAAAPMPVVALLVGGAAGTIIYAVLAVPRAQMRQWLDALRRRQAHAVAE